MYGHVPPPPPAPCATVDLRVTPSTLSTSWRTLPRQKKVCGTRRACLNVFDLDVSVGDGLASALRRKNSPVAISHRTAAAPACAARRARRGAANHADCPRPRTSSPAQSRCRCLPSSIAGSRLISSSRVEPGLSRPRNLTMFSLSSALALSCAPTSCLQVLPRSRSNGISAAPILYTSPHCPSTRP